MNRFASFTPLLFQRSLTTLTVALLLMTATLPTQAKESGSIKIQAGQQVFEPFEGRSQFDGNVRVAMEDTEITAPHANIQLDEKGKPSAAVFTNRSKLVRKTNGMKQTVQADTLNMGLQSGALHAEGRVMTQLSGDKSMGDVSIQSDSQVFEQDKGIMRALGHVTIRKDDTVATSPEAMILFNEAGAANKVIFVKGARLVQGDQEMRGETITVKLDTGDIYAERNTESTVLDKDSQGKPTKIKITAHLQELDNKTGTLLANGNTVVNYVDYIAKGPKAVFYRANNQLDRIVMSGRAQIEDPERRVVGDVVTITVNPRQFNAQGNVTTFIKAKKKPLASPSPASTAGSTKTSGPKTATTTAATSAPASKSAWDDEIMLEKMTQEAQSASPAGSIDTAP